MLQQKIKAFSWCLSVVLCVTACTSDKQLPQGKRISVLEQATVIKPDVANADSVIKIAAPLNMSSWLQKDVNAQHIVPNIKVGTEFKKQWRSDFGKGKSKRELLMAKPLILKDKVFALDAAGKLSAFRLEDGELLWQVKLISDNDNIDDTSLKGVGLAAENDVLYVTTGFGVVVAVKAKDGSKVWENNLKSPLRIAPTVAADKVFVQSVDNKFFALDAKSGEILWDYDIAVENTTIVGGASAAYAPELDMIITGFSNGELQAFSAGYGAPLWTDDLVANHQAYSSTLLHTIKASPIVEGETVYALGTAKVFVAINARNGSRVWEKEISGMSTPVLCGNTLFAVTQDNELVAVNKANGDVLWATPIELFGKSSDVQVYAPVMLANRLVISLSNGVVQTYDALSGKKINKIKLGEKLNSEPIAANGYIVFVTANAKIIAYK